MTQTQVAIQVVSIGELQYRDFLFKFSLTSLGEVIRYNLSWLKGDKLFELFASYDEAHEYINDEVDRVGVTFELAVEQCGYEFGSDSFSSLAGMLDKINDLTTEP